MTPTEFAKSMIFLGQAYDKEFKKDQLNVWYSFFEHEEDTDFRKAIARLVVKSKFLPSIADLKEEIARLKNDFLQLDPNEEWAKVEKAIGKYGMYNAGEAENSFEPFTALVVHHMGGFRKICLSEDGDWTRKNFLRLWNDLKDAKKNPLLYRESYMTLPELMQMSAIREEERKLLNG